MNQEQEHMSKDFNFCHLQEIYPTHIENISWLLLKTGLDTLKTAFKKVVPKSVEATTEIIGKQFAKNL